MPLTEPDLDIPTDPRTQLWVQLPFVVLMLLLGGLALVVIPEARGAVGVWISVVLAIVATLLGAVVPWSRLSPQSPAIVAALDIVAVGHLREAVLEWMPSVGILIMFPVLWLAYSFSAWAFVLIVGGSLYGMVLPYVRDGRVPASALDWANVLTLPTALIVLCASVHVAARVLRRHRHYLSETSKALNRSLLALRQREAMLASVAGAVDEAVAVLDHDGKVIFTNESFDREAAASRWDSRALASGLVYAADRVRRLPPEEQLFQRALTGDFVDRELHWIGEPGALRAFVSTTRPVHAGENAAIVFASYDVTDLMEAVRAREQLLADVSHELRTPLTSVVGHLELLTDAIDPEQSGLAAHLRSMQRGVDQLVARVADIVTVSDGRFSLRRRSIDLSVLLAGAVAAARPRAESREVALEHERAPRLNADVDPARLMHAVENVLANAIAYSHSGGRVRVGLEAHGDHAVITIADDGVGMTSDEERRSREPFFRSDLARAAAIPGSGLGLTIAQRIVDAHRGRLDIASELGAGTVVTMTLPLQVVARRGGSADGGTARA